MTSISALLQQPIAEILAWTLLHFIWQGALVGICLYLILKSLVNASPNLRYNLARCALLCVLCFPIGTAAWLYASLLQQPLSRATPVAQGQELSRLDIATQTMFALPLEKEDAMRSAYSLVSTFPRHPKTASLPPTRLREPLSLRTVLPFVVITWMLGVALLSLRLFGSWLVLKRLRVRATRMAPVALQKRLITLSRQLQIKQTVRLLESRIAGVPMTMGWRQPVILLPSNVISCLGLDKLELILAHELAHIRRYDWLIVILQRVTETLFFYHPLVWWLSQQLELERENSCDDVAVTVCGDAVAYAKALAELAALQQRPQFVLAASGGSLLYRIRRLMMRSTVQTQTYNPARALASSAIATALIAVSILAFSTRLAFAQADYNEAPQLAAQVAAGTLPPVSERLPENPLVIEPVERIGQYGGDWNTGLLGVQDTHWMVRTIGGEGLVVWSRDWNSIVPNIAESYEVNEEGTEFTFHLREGMHWSDGHPFTADDIMFWYEDIFLNEELTPVQTNWLISGGEPVTVEKVDDYTVVFRFAEPNGLFLQRMAMEEMMVRAPRHYFEQFHQSFNPEGIDALVREHGASDWVNLFVSMGWDSRTQFQNAIPTLRAWVITTPLGDGARVVAERNPYYWKVDTEGNQLPYLDRVVYHMADNAEVLVLRAMSGEIDMMNRHINTLDNKAVFTDNMEQGDYRFFDEALDMMNTTSIGFNLSHKDPVKREIFQNRDFRIGLSYAINREEIIDLAYVGQGKPYQVAPRPESQFYDEEMAKQYTEYNVDLANEHLDRAGYTQRDSEGYRLGPDGQRISFVLEYYNDFSPEWTGVLELIQGYWRDVGIDMQMRNIDRSLLQTRLAANEHDVSLWGGYGGLNVFLDPRWYFPYAPTGNGSIFAKAWAQWFINDPRGEEPPAPQKRQIELYRQIMVTVDPDQQAELMREILEIAKDEFHAIGITLPAQGYGIVKNNFHNVPDLLVSTTTISPAHVVTSQFFKGD